MKISSVPSKSTADLKQLNLNSYNMENLSGENFFG